MLFGTPKFARFRTLKPSASNCRLDALRQTKPATHAQIKRREIKSASCISPNTERPIVVVSVEITIVSEQHVERQTGTVSENVSELKTSQRTRETVGFALLRRFERATHYEAMTLIVIRETTIISDVEIVLHAREKEVAGIVDRF